MEQINSYPQTKPNEPNHRAREGPEQCSLARVFTNSFPGSRGTTVLRNRKATNILTGRVSVSIRLSFIITILLKGKQSTSSSGHKARQFVKPQSKTIMYCILTKAIYTKTAKHARYAPHSSLLRTTRPVHLTLF
jgi:hypothetical protein